jgi:hypothetical protein
MRQELKIYRNSLVTLKQKQKKTEGIKLFIIILCCTPKKIQHCRHNTTHLRLQFVVMYAHVRATPEAKSLIGF